MRPDVPRRLPLYCFEDRDRHGNVRVYFRRAVGEPRTRLLGTPWTPEFMAAYEAAKTGQVAPKPAGRQKAKPGTWRWLCERYCASEGFREGLDDRTKRVRRSILEATFDEPTKPGAATKFADFPLDRMTAKAVKVLRDRKEAKKEAANGRLKAIRQVFAFGLAQDPPLVASNPARDVPYYQTRSPGFHTWTIDEAEAFLARHPIGTKAALALALLLLVGGRRADIPALGRQHISAGWLRYTQHKNRNRDPVTLELPVLPALARIIEATPAAKGDLTFLRTEFGKPFTANGFGNWFKKRCREAGVPGSAHGLRKAGATIAAENGATEAQLMAIFGWKSWKQAARYTRAARQKTLAGGAMHLIAWGENGAIAGKNEGETNASQIS